MRVCAVCRCYRMRCSRWRIWEPRKLRCTAADHRHPTARTADLSATDASGGFDLVEPAAYELMRQAYKF